MSLRVLWRTLFVSVLLLVPFGIWVAPHTTASIFEGILFIAPIWLPLLLLAILLPLWISYVRSQYIFNVPYATLELKAGDATPKTARAMELIFYSLHHRNDISLTKELLFGEVRLPWSFEIAVTDGTVRFFMRIPKAHRQALELRIRSEYKDIDIDEVRDYAREERFDPISMKLEMREFKLRKPDPFPLKTYEAHEAEKKPHDPLMKFLEDLVSVGASEHLYISFIIRPHQRTRRRWWEEPVDTLHSDAQQEIAHILGAGGDMRAIPEGKQKLVNLIEQALKKPAFDCGIRALYFAERSTFNEERAEKLNRLFDVFADTELNELEAYTPRENVSWPLSDVFTAIPWLYELYAHNLFRRRAYFSPPYYGKTFVLNTAEIATLYHLPHITRASALARGSGRRLEPPDNLPV